MYEVFYDKELCRSTTADRKGIDNRCGCDIEANLTALVDNVLDPRYANGMANLSL